MQYFLQGKNIIFKDKAEQIKCYDFDHALHSEIPTANFIQKNYYQTAVSSISDILENNRKAKELDTLILNSQFFSCPGLIDSFIDRIGNETKIQSDLEFAISSQNLKSGYYSLVDISENESFHYNFAIDSNNYSLLEKTKLDNSKLKRVIANKFATTQADALFHSLFNYSNIIEANQFIETNEITEADFSNYTLSEISLGNIFDIDFSNFFEKLCSSIQDFINDHTSDEKSLLIKSPLTGFQPVKSILSSNKKLAIISELDFLNYTNNFDFLKYKISSDRFEFNCYPSNKKIVFPFSSWVLSETRNLSIELLKISGGETKSYQINLIDLKERLLDTFFSINDKQLVKYFVELEMDICNNLHLKVETLDKQEFYYLINN